jgi:hypothetical protein
MQRGAAPVAWQRDILHAMMNSLPCRTALLFVLSMAFTAMACGGNEADRRGVGAECADTDDCFEDGQECLAFKGGYCGVTGCAEDLDCPDGSACIAHTDQVNYCFRICATKDECNTHRAVENEANCSSNVTFVEGAMGRKACVPPSGS